MLDPPAPPVSSRSGPRAAIILAAGKSTRMRSRLPKALHPLCGRALTRHVIEACRLAGIDDVVVVVGHEAQRVREGLGADVRYAVQAEQRGTGDAAQSAASALGGFTGTVLVLAGDVPLLRPETLGILVERHEQSGAAATLLTAYLEDPAGYGRIVRRDDGTVARIVEHRDASAEERAIKEWNPSIYAFRSDALFGALREIRPDNDQGELYLTDAIGILAAQGERIEAIPTADTREVLGVNTRVELSQAAAVLRRNILDGLMLAGVSVVDPITTYVDVGVTVGRDSVLEPQTFLHGSTSIGEECVIGPNARLIDTRVGDGCQILASNIVQCEVASHVRIGPYANLRPGCRIADRAKIGDFVELKNTVVGEKVSASHLSYLGDADIGAGTNIGAGTITCNYDGIRKHRTRIGAGAFIGSHATLIAPVEIGDGAYVGAASPIDQDVPADSLAIARSRQTVKPGWAAERLRRSARGPRTEP